MCIRDRYKRGLFLLEGGFLTVKQPYNTTIYNTVLYLRLSRDDELQGESGSSQTQKMMLRQYAAEHGQMCIRDRSKSDLSFSSCPASGQTKSSQNMARLSAVSLVMRLFPVW